MSTLSDLVARHGVITPADLDWLHQLVGDWQILSDLSFADLVLWYPTSTGGFVAVAHCRPSTGATVHHEDVVGVLASDGEAPALHAALHTGVIQRGNEPRWNGAFAIREEAVPVVRERRPLAVIARQTSVGSSRTPSRLEINYIEAADELCGMISRGEYPNPNSATGRLRGAPRVGDGLIRLNPDGDVVYASPNALSCFHRFGLIGELVGRNLAEVASESVADAELVDESLPLVTMGRAAWRTDMESPGVSLSLRAIPVVEHGERKGALVLCRDVSELRRREQELVTKDATIREIHHRVKNNLQTVAALLRLQARRTTSADARSALQEAMRRVATIATVHEALSQTIDEVVEFDDVFGRTLRLAADVASGESQPRIVREGEFGPINSTSATSLAVVLTELVTNAVEHGLAGRDGIVRIIAERDGETLLVKVVDDGVGMLPGAAPSGTGLGMQIVRILVTGELRGSISWEQAPGGGTEVTLRIRVGPGRE